MAVPTVNVTCTVTNQTGAVVAGATVTAQLTGIDLYGTNYIFPSVQSFVTDGAGLVTMPLFPNALGARRTAYQFIAIDPVTGRALINITAVVPNQNIDLSVLDAINRLPAYAPPLTQPFSATLASLASLGVAVGAILFGGPGQSVLQDVNLLWDNTTKRLKTGPVGIGVVGTGLGLIVNPGNVLGLTGAGTTNVTIAAQDATGNLALDVRNSSTGASIFSVANNGPVTAVTSVVTPLVDIRGVVSPKITFTPLSGSTRVGSFYQNGDTLFMAQDGVANRLQMDLATGSITPAADNAATLGSGSFKWSTGNFGTSVVTPLVQGGAGLVVNANAGDINFQTVGTRRWNIVNSTSSLQPDQDNTWNLGDPAARIAKVFSPILDSGGAVALSLRTNNGTEQVRVSHIGSAVNFFYMQGNSTGAAPTIGAEGSDTNVGLIIFSQGSGTLDFRTNTNVNSQFQVLHTASANRAITVTGSNGGNPVLNTTTGGLDLSSATIRFPNIGTTAVAANATLNAVGSNDLLRSTSSKRYKTEIEALSRDEALTLLRKLNPITYASLSEHDDPYLRHSGFIAEDVFDINPLFVSLSNKRPESVQYERLTVPLVAGWQDHDARLAALEARIHTNH